MPTSCRCFLSFRFLHQKPAHTCLLSRNCEEQCLIKTLPSSMKLQGDNSCTLHHTKHTASCNIWPVVHIPYYEARTHKPSSFWLNHKNIDLIAQIMSALSSISRIEKITYYVVMLPTERTRYTKKNVEHMLIVLDWQEQLRPWQRG